MLYLRRFITPFLFFVLNFFPAALVHADADDSYTGATSFSLNASYSGSLSSSDTVDWWRVNVSAIGDLQVNLGVPCSSGTIDIDLALYTSPTGSPVATSQNGACQGESVRFTMNYSGWYYVRIYRFGSSGSGSYNVSATVITPAYDASTFLPALETYPDGTSVYVDQSFTKTWTVRNNGTTTWNGSYYLQYVTGPLSTSHANVPVNTTVPPGSNYTFSVPMRTPSSPGTYRDDWSFKNPAGVTINVDSSSTVWALINVIPRPLPNLTFTTPSGWSAPIVPANSTGTTTMGSLSGCQPTFVDWAIINSGSSTATSTFWTALYLDGALQSSWSWSNLLSGQILWSFDSQLSISPGVHTLQIVPDYSGVIAESNESDNAYALTTTWSDCAPTIALSSPTSGSTMAASSITVSGSCADAGGNLDYADVVDTTNGSSGIDYGPSGASSSFSVSGISLSFGTNTIQATCHDTNGNTAVTTATVTRPNVPDLRPYVPSGWSGAIVATSEFGSTLYACRSTAFDFALQNADDGSADGTFFNYILIDGNFYTQWIKNGLSAHGSDALIGYTISSIAPGWHTVTFTADATGAISESNEVNNSTSSSFYWNACNPPVVSLTAPPNGTVTTATPIAVAGSCSDVDGNLSGVTVVNTTTGGSSSQGMSGVSSSFNLTFPLAIGWNTVQATCSDTFGASNAATVSINYDICSDGTLKDTIGDPCNHNQDGDARRDDVDTCPFDFDDPIGDPCNHDEDGDGVPDIADACPFSPNDPIGDPCNHDEDGDGIPDVADQCPFLVGNGDAVGDPCVPTDCADRSAPDTIGQACNHDEDGDGVADVDDACPFSPNDPIGDPCNHDEDGDGVPDIADACPFSPNDPIGDPCNHDEDGDGIPDVNDSCPFYHNDTINNACDPNDNSNLVFNGGPISVTVLQGAVDQSQEFRVTNTGTGPMNYQLASNGAGAWMSVVKNGGEANAESRAEHVLAPGDTDRYTVRLVANRAAPAGSSQATITVTSNDSSDGSATLPVSMSVATPPYCSTESQCRVAPAQTLGNHHPNTQNFSDPVNTATGNYAYEHLDLALAGRGIALAFSRTYNSQDKYLGPLGFGWTHSFNLALTALADGAVQIKWGDGRIETYEPRGDGDYISPQGVFSNLAADASSGGYTLTAKSHVVFRFASSGRLEEMRDRSGNTVSLNYDEKNRLIRVTDGVGRFFLFAYAGEDPFKISAVTDSAGRGISFVYDGDDLSQFTDASGNMYRYVSDQHQLERVVDPTGTFVVDNSYDSFGRVTQQRDGRGNASRIAYESPDPGMVTVTDPLGQTLQQVYDAELRIVASSDSLGRAWQYEYNAAGLRTGVVDRSQKRLDANYDERGNLITLTDAQGNTTRFEYAAATDDLVKVILPSGHERHFAYDAAGHLTRVWEMLDEELIESRTTYNEWGQPLTMTDAEGNSIAVSYDALGNVAEITAADGGVTHFAYDDVGRIVATTDPLGRTTRYEHNTQGLTTRVVDPAGHASHFEYDANDWLTLATDRTGRSLAYHWNENGFLAATIDASGNETTSVYDKLNRRTQVTDPEGRSVHFEYDTVGNISAVIDPSGRTIRFAHDEEGNVIAETNAAGKVWSYDYDELGRLVAETDPLGAATRYEYDVVTGAVSRMIDAAGETTAYRYDGLGRLVAIVNPLQQTTAFAYDKIGNLIWLSDPAGNETTFSYDGVGRKTAERDPVSDIEHRSYDLAGQLIRSVDGKGWETRYAYDDAGNLTTIVAADGTTVDYSYDAQGRRLARNDGLGTTTYAYDAIGRLNRLDDARGFSLGYQYDRSGLLTAIIYPNQRTLVYGYNASRQMTSVTDWLGKTTSYRYDAAGRLVELAYPNGFSAGYTYDDASQLVGLVNRRPDGTLLSSSQWTIDALGRRVAVEQQDSLVPAWIAAEETNGTANAGNQLTQFGSSTYGYDADGNLSSRDSPQGRTNFTFDARGRLAAIEESGEHTSFNYDGDGNRVGLTRNGTTTQFVVDPERSLPDVLADVDGSGALQHSYLYGLGLIGRISEDGSEVRYYHYDSTGSTLALSDAAGNITDHYRYDEFGRVNHHVGMTDNPFQFAGQLGVQNDGTGFYFMRARYYDPQVGRFVSRDPLGLHAGLNRYAYAANDPLRYTDASGLFLDTLLDVAFVALDLGILAYDELANGGKNRALNVAALSLDVAFTFIPFATGGGAALRLAAHGGEVAKDVGMTVRTTEELAHAGEEVASHSREIITASKSAGESVGKMSQELGKAGQEMLEKVVGKGKRTTAKLEVNGEVHNIKLDWEAEQAVHESKNVKLTNSPGIRQQMDNYLEYAQGQGKELVYHLWKGGSAGVKKELETRGIKYIDYATLGASQAAGVSSLARLGAGTTIDVLRAGGHLADALLQGAGPQSAQARPK